MARMKAKPIIIKIAPDQIDFFGAVLNCAVRYCIGRRTYMPGLVTDWIMQHCAGMLTGKTIGVMKRDIDEAASRDGLGDGCDIRTWVNFRTWLETQEAGETPLRRIANGNEKADGDGKRSAAAAERRAGDTDSRA